MTPRIIFVPNLIPEHGMGHLQRCRSVCLELAGLAALWLCRDPELLGTTSLFAESTLTDYVEGLPLWSDQGAPWPLVVVDFQRTPSPLLAFLQARAEVLLGWDEGGAQRRFFPYLLDSLPHQTSPGPNQREPGLLGYPLPALERFHRPIQSILISFGGVDPANLTLKTLQMLRHLPAAERSAWSLTVVRGPLATWSAASLGPATDFRWLEPGPNLRAWLGQFDLVITAWGLTVLESLSAGTPVLTVNPTAYHHHMALQAGIPSLGVGKPQTQSFRQALKTVATACQAAASTLLAPPVAPAEYFATFAGSSARCPVCKTPGHPVFFRSRHKSYHACASCGLDFLSVYQLPAKEYSAAYFFEDYQRQYGKTYLDDFDHIVQLGHDRLDFFAKRLRAPLQGSVLDVGCAYGPFLAAAAARGLDPVGLDIAPSAVEYVQKQLGFPAVQGSFLDWNWAASFPDRARPQVVTMWYVIEHFPDLDQVLRQVARLLPRGGYFLFSTPHGRGITRLFQPSKFWTESPDDHFSIWNRSNARRILRRYGFRVRGFRITGHHPERFPGLRSARGWKAALVRALSWIFGWGDTFEVYAEKIQERS